MAKGNTAKETVKPFKAIVKQLEDAGVEVYGIGAPHFPERSDFWPFEDELQDALSDVYAPGHLIDAAPLTENYKMHAGGKSAQGFAERLHAALRGE